MQINQLIRSQATHDLNALRAAEEENARMALLWHHLHQANQARQNTKAARIRALFHCTIL